MRLANFLETDKEAILVAAAEYARTIPVLRDTDDATLRNHLPHLLAAISADLRTHQSRTQSIAKSEGVTSVDGQITSAQTHGLFRARLGISIEQLIAEFRALRSSILRLWMDKHSMETTAVEDITRFNEAIDQAVAECVQFFDQERERWRQIFLGVLGHDLRAPLNSIALIAEVMRRGSSNLPEQTALLARAVKRLTSLLDSLLEYNRAGFGAGMQLQHGACDLKEACSEELELLRAANPGADIKLSDLGDTHANVDSSRVREVLSNLVTNAVKHGEAEQPIFVNIDGNQSMVRISVENFGSIPPGQIEKLFEPLRRGGLPSTNSERTHLGLGLFIARQIARAHGGEAFGACSDGIGRFTIELPKSVSAPIKGESQVPIGDLEGSS